MKGFHLFSLLLIFIHPSFTDITNLERIHLSDDGKHFIESESGEPFVLWGVNYDHDENGRLLEDYWVEEWEKVVEDFEEIKNLGANVVRIHLQVAKFMESPVETKDVNLARLRKLVTLAEETGLYLNITGLGCYHKDDVPAWYDEMKESARWDVQIRFWQAIADVCKDSPAIFCYDLMNEPILPGKEKKETEWLAGELGGKHFVQRITLDLAGRTREKVAKQWIQKLTHAIRKIDTRHMITVGVIPWAHVFPGAKPLFYSSKIARHLDFVSVHFYPERDKVEKALTALKVYEIDKPLVVEEIFPLKCSLDEANQFIEKSSEFCDGWISFYWGKTIEEYEKENTIKSALIAKWLKYFKKKGKTIQ